MITSDTTEPPFRRSQTRNTPHDRDDAMHDHCRLKKQPPYSRVQTHMHDTETRRDSQEGPCACRCVTAEMDLDPTLCTMVATGAGLLLLLLCTVGRNKGQKVPGSLVLISGASQGIGEAVARLLAARGARVVLLARSFEKLEAVKASIEKANRPGCAFVFKCDCSVPADVERVAKEIRKIGVPDVIINNAGAGRWKYLPETDLDEIHGNFNAPPLAAAYLTRAFFMDFLDRNSGAVVQIMSPAALVPFPGGTGYNMARWALRGFSEALSGDLWGTKVRVQDVWLGEVQSEYFKNNPGSAERLPPGSQSITTDQAAKAVVRAITSGARHTYEPRSLCVLFSWMPSITRAWLGVHGMKIRTNALIALRQKKD